MSSSGHCAFAQESTTLPECLTNLLGLFLEASCEMGKRGLLLSVHLPGPQTAQRAGSTSFLSVFGRGFPEGVSDGARTQASAILVLQPLELPDTVRDSCTVFQKAQSSNPRHLA